MSWEEEEEARSRVYGLIFCSNLWDFFLQYTALRFEEGLMMQGIFCFFRVYINVNFRSQL